MGDYRKRSENFGVPVPGKPVIIKEKVIEKESSNDIDLNALADLIADKVSQGVKIPSNIGIINSGDNSARNFQDNFDDTSSMNQLAESMVVQRGAKSSNFDNLGGVKETKKNDSQTTSTIDLLSNLED